MTHDSINNPSHYAEGRAHEPIAVIEDWGLNYRLGNTVKYISRAGRKQNALEDLKKARWYLDREIESLEPSVPFAATYEDILEDAVHAATEGEDLLNEYGVNGIDEDRAATIKRLSDNAVRGYESKVSDQATSQDWSDFWADWDESVWSDFWAGWDEPVGPTEAWLSDNEINSLLGKKNLEQFDPDEIVSTVEKRGFILGVKKDGSTCELKNGRCL